jgi:hypothetical protein
MLGMRIFDRPQRCNPGDVFEQIAGIAQRLEPSGGGFCPLSDLASRLLQAAGLGG